MSDPLKRAGDGSVPPCCRSEAPPALPSRSSLLGAGAFDSGINSYGATGMNPNLSYSGLGLGAGYGGGSMYSAGYASGIGSMPGSFGSYGTRYGAAPSPFVRSAEENARPAFESVEGVVQAVGAVSMMLESTYGAIHNSFRAVLGLADQFSRIQGQMSEVLANLLPIRLTRWLLRRVALLLGLRSEDAVDGSDEDKGGGSKRSWLLVLFFSVILGAPWLVWKLLRKDSRLEDEYRVARVMYDFTPQSQQEVPLTAGQTVTLAPKSMQPQIDGWLLASVDGERSGLIPRDYVKILRPGVEIPAEAHSLPPVHQEVRESESCCHGNNTRTVDNENDSALEKAEENNSNGIGLNSEFSDSSSVTCESFDGDTSSKSLSSSRKCCKKSTG